MLDPNMPILVVDDYATMVKIIRNLLKQIGFLDVDTARNGAEALELARAKSYGLIISDWNMEPMSGYELLQSVRTEKRNEKTAFLMVTAESRVENITAARAAGVSGYLVKPFDAIQLRERVAMAMGETIAA